jgi:[ribosomal protein S18]-alanine N-acetyltransferase
VIEVREISPGDLDGLVELAQGAREGPKWTRHEYEQILLSRAPLLRLGLVAVDDVALAGFAVASYVVGDDSAEVEGLVVEAGHRRLGIGRALVKACMAWAGKAGATGMRLEVRASNAPAIGLYRSLGFVEAGIRPGYYSVPREDALLLATSIILQGSGLKYGS